MVVAVFVFVAVAVEVDEAVCVAVAVRVAVEVEVFVAVGVAVFVALAVAVAVAVDVEVELAVGVAVPVRVDVRVIAATHQELEERVKQNLFREDLLHRLNVIRIAMPALRERPDDVEDLAAHFALHFAREMGRPERRLSTAARRSVTACRAR